MYDILQMTKLDMLSDVLHDFCVKQGLEFMSADDILFSDLDLTEYQKQWLRSYIETWDIIQEVSWI